MKLPETDTHFRGLKNIHQNGYQRQALFHALAFVNQWRVAIDVGAHVGYMTKDMAPLFQKVYAFEPEQMNYRCLLENKAGNVETHRIALGATRGGGRMETPLESNSGAWQFVRDDDHLTCLPLYPLDEFLLEPDFIKIDVQGMELDVLKGAEKTLAEHHPVLLVETTMDGVQNKEIFRWLMARGYDYSVKSGKNTVFIWKQK